MESITQYVEQRLKLKVNRRRASVVALAKRRFFLSFGFLVRDGEVRVRIDPKALKRAKERLRQLTSRKRGVSMEQRIDELNRYTVGWMAYFALADTPTVFQRLDGWLRRRLRQVRWKEWKRARKARLRNLRAAGIPPERPPRMVLLAQGLLAHLQLSRPRPRAAQRLLGRPWPGRVLQTLPPLPGCQANRRMRTRTSGGVGGRRGEPGAYPIDRGAIISLRGSPPGLSCRSERCSA